MYYYCGISFQFFSALMIYLILNFNPLLDAMCRHCNISCFNRTVVFDVSKAFYTVDTQASVGLLYKLKSYGIFFNCSAVLLFVF